MPGDMWGPTAVGGSDPSRAESRSETSSTVSGQLRQVTAVFADVSGYTRISERLDPEDVRLLVSDVTARAEAAVAAYDGHIEQLLGDGIMAVFGIPRCHEDDAVRAVWAAREIARSVGEIEFVDGNGAPLDIKMHTGIATGPVIASGVATGRASDAILGDTVNIASRLADMAGPDEIVVSSLTYEMTSGLFEYEPLGEVGIRGREARLRAYRLTAPRIEPTTLHRTTGLRSKLIARDSEMKVLLESARRGASGIGSAVLMVGPPGSGKTRLVSELCQHLDHDGIQLREAHCFEYASHTPYAALSDLLGRAWGIEPETPPDEVRDRVDAAVKRLLGKGDAVAARVGQLFGLEPEDDEAALDPATWRLRLFDDVLRLTEALSAAGPTVIILEDLHWADEPSLELLAFVARRLSSPVTFVATSRTSDPVERLAAALPELSERHALLLHDLRPNESIDLARSLLDSPRLPAQLEGFLTDKLAGNPFHVEEFLNMLVDREDLIRVDGEWVLTHPLDAAVVPSSVSAAVEARLDRLDPVTQAVAREAAVLGRVFATDTLRALSHYSEHIEEALESLEGHSILVRTPPGVDGDYTFKHALTQNAIQGTLLRGERADIHERTARAFVDLYADRLPEFYEAIAMHFANGTSPENAIRYLRLAGIKNLWRYALNEADQLFAQAHRILLAHQDAAGSANQLSDLVTSWSRVLYYLGEFERLESLLFEHYELVSAQTDPSRVATYEIWLGSTLWHRQQTRSAVQHLLQGLRVANRCADTRQIGLAHAWLAYAMCDLGRLRHALRHGAAACEIARSLPSDGEVWEEAFAAAGYAYWARGDPQPAFDAGRELIEFGTERGNSRCVAFGHWTVSSGYLMDGDYVKAEEEIALALDASSDPWLRQFPKFFAGMSAIMHHRYADAEQILREVTEYCAERGALAVGSPAQGLLGAALAGLGQIDKGLDMVMAATESCLVQERAWPYVHCLFILGELHARVYTNRAPIGVGILLKNPRFIVSRALRADKIARAYLTETILRAEAMGANGMAGQAWLSLAELHQARGRSAEATRCLARAESHLVACGIRAHLERVRTLSQPQSFLH